MNPLDAPIWHALSGPQAHLAIGGGLARRFRPDIAPFAALAAETDQAWGELAELAPGHPVALFTIDPVAIPAGWRLLLVLTLEQMVCEWLRPPRRTIVPVELGPEDVLNMLALVELTEPGPFASGTIACGRYVGWRAPDGGLAAMGGERMSIGSFVEISAVCTRLEHRGTGLAGALVHTLAAAMVARGHTPLLHVRDDNQSAIALYDALGFRRRRTIHLTVLQHGG